MSLHSKRRRKWLRRMFALARSEGSSGPQTVQEYREGLAEMARAWENAKLGRVNLPPLGVDRSPWKWKLERGKE